MPFVKAERRRVPVKVALAGPSGSGKTYSALLLAFGLGGRVAMVDTESGSGSLYAHLGDYDTLELRAPFTVAKYLDAITQAVEAGYSCLIIDSISHEWSGEGGLLAQKEALDVRGGNSFTNWASITKQHEQFKAALVEAPIHLICTMRSKEEHILGQDERGRPTVKKAGMAPIQREGISYEFTVLFELQASDQSAIAGKDRTGLFEGLNHRLTSQHGASIARWLESGAEPLPMPVPAPVTTMPAQNATAPATAPPAPGAMICSWHPCANPLTKGQYEVSLKAYGTPLCPAHQKKAAAGEEIPAMLDAIPAPPAPVAEPEDKPTPEQQAQWKTLVAEAREHGVDIERWRPTGTMSRTDVETMLLAVTGILAEERTKREQAARESAEVAA